MQAERPSDIMRRARAFADLHVREGAEELLEWHSTGKLRGGRVRELAVMYRPITDTDTIQFAEREFEKAALRACARTLDAAPSEPSADDLIERLRALSRCEHSDYTIGDEAADELARLRAEVAGSQDVMDDCDAEIERLGAEVEELRTERRNILQSACEATDEVARLRRMNEGMRQQHATDSMTLRNLCSERDMQRQRATTAERERDELRRRIAEAVVVQVDQIYPVSLHGIGAIDCVTIRLIGSDAKAVGGQRVALVRLDAEDRK